MKKTQSDKQKTFLYILFLGLVAASFSIISFMTGHDNDYLWHTTLGKYIVENKSIFKTDIYSWIGIELGLEETAHSWASSVLIYLTSLISDNKFVGALFFNAITSFTCYLVYQKLFIKKVSMMSFVAAIIIGLLSGVTRPQNIGYILFVVMMWALCKLYKERSNKAIITLGVVSVLWANFHGGSIVLLFGFEIVFLIFGLVPKLEIGNFEFEKSTKYDIKYVYQNPKKYFEVPLRFVKALVITVIAGLINPYGIRLYAYALGTNNEVTKMNIAEWLPANIGNMKAIIILFVLVCPLFLCKKRIKAEIWLIVFGLYLAGGIYTRFLVYGIFWGLLLAQDTIEELTERFKDVVVGKWIKNMARICLVLVIASTMFLNRSGIYSSELVSNRVIEYIKGANYKRLYNGYNEGSFLIYNEIPCFVDARADLYPAELLSGAEQVEAYRFAFPGQLDDFLRKYEFDGIMLNMQDVSLFEHLSGCEEWEFDTLVDNYAFFRHI